MTLTFDTLDAQVARRQRERALLDVLPSPAERRRLRERAGVSQEDVARVVGVTREAVTRWESGLRTPRGQRLDQYVQVLHHLADATEESAA